MAGYGYPIFLNVERMPVVIVGGGAVAARKARGLLAAGATQIRAIAPAFAPDMPPEVKKVREMFRAEHLQDSKLVIAATDDPAVNEAVVVQARRMGALAARADAQGEDHGDFIVPAVWRKEALSVAISTGGAPLLAKQVRDGVGQWIDPRWVAMANAMASVRPVINAAAAPERRREIYQSLLSDDALEVAAAEGPDGLLKWLSGQYPDLGLPPATMREKEEM